MRFGNRVKGLAAVVVLLLVPGVLLGSTGHYRMGPTSSALNEMNPPQEASALLNKMKSQALKARDLADELQVYQRDHETALWEGDADVLMNMKADVNNMDDTLYSLRSMQEDLLPWQAKAVDRVAPTAIELTDFVEEGIHNLNRHHITLHILDHSYTQEIEGMHQRANSIARSIGKFQEYETAMSQIRELSPELGLKAAS